MSEPKPITVAQIERIKKEVHRISGVVSYADHDHPELETKLISSVIQGKTRRRDLTKNEACEVIDSLKYVPSPRDPKMRAERAAMQPCTPEDSCTFCGAVGDGEHACTDGGDEIKDCRIERTNRCATCEARARLS